jgi:hypothetical protein
MIAAYLILTLIAVVLQVVSYRKHDEMNSIGVIANVLAAIVATIAFIIGGSNDSVSGGYIYYVNGVKMESGFMTVGATIVLAIISFGTSFGASMGLGYLIGHKRDAEEKAKPKVWVLILSILAIPFGSGFFRSISLLPDLSVTGRLLVLGLGAITWGLGILGIVSYIIKKKRANK